MPIIILDGYTTNSGDLSWEALSELGDVTVYPRTAPEEVLERIGEAEVVLLNKARITAEVIRQAPNLRYIGILATGYNTVDIEAAKEKGIVVCNAANYGTASVAQHVFALLLELTNKVIMHHESVMAGTWSRSADWTYRLGPMMELAGKTMGIIGLGAIGQQTARIAQAFGMEVIAHTRTPKNVEGVSLTDLDTLFRHADVISLHCPLTPETENLINRSSLSIMKPSAILLNTGRGGLIHEQDLLHALENGTIAAAGLDVLSSEPPSPDNPLLRAPNCLITPHNAWGTRESRQRLIEIATENVRAWMEGRARNVVNG